MHINNLYVSSAFNIVLRVSDSRDQDLKCYFKHSNVLRMMPWIKNNRFLQCEFFKGADVVSNF